ncbi:MAG: F0F1 ATP synthase subunit delta [Prevotella conceptionensis]|jgi:hypothetical protein|uniref:F0F1 ATP synthase subunit delta n=1 Tax=Prevotella conceptionensis TaxID=340486 RepID=UPI0002F095F4|nr:F0F1 ATP synthase subunit delta [Prevotella conceptionensis]
MDIGLIAVRYARALLKAAIDDRCYEDVYNNMTNLLECYLHVPELRPAVCNPMYSRSKKSSVVMAACGTPAVELTKRFIALVLREGREDLLQFIASSFINLYRQHFHITSGKITTAVQLTAEVEQRMRHLVEERTQGTVEFTTEVDPAILGGFVLDYDTYRMDASVKSKLNRILIELKNK